jgi:hypothetical protein
VSGREFLAAAEALQTEAFGSAALLVVARESREAADVMDRLEGNLTGAIYSDSRGTDDALYDELAPRLRPHVGRLLNDKMPTGVAVSPAMNHGGPFPATGHPGFTAVGIPASLRRFAMLQCYDNVRPDRLPLLRDKNRRAACGGSSTVRLRGRRHGGQPPVVNVGHGLLGAFESSGAASWGTPAGDANACRTIGSANSRRQEDAIWADDGTTIFLRHVARCRRTKSHSPRPAPSPGRRRHRHTPKRRRQACTTVRGPVLVI